jgi:hypothetical protein
VQEVAAAVQQSTGHGTLLARLGAHGKHNQNAQRDLYRMVKTAARMGLEISWIRVPVKQRRSRAVQHVRYPIIAPHEMLSAAWRCQHPMFRVSREEVLQFWDMVAPEEWSAVHPVRAKSREDLSKALPIMLHGDEGTGHKKRGLFILQWGPVLGGGTNVLDSRLLITVIPSRLCVKGPRKRNLTLDTVYRFVTWSIAQMLDGGWPRQGPVIRRGRAGTQLAGGFTAAWAGLKGDWKYTKEATQATRHYNTIKFMCPSCFASGSIPELRYNDPRSTAGWRKTVESHADWLRNTRPEDRSELAAIPGWHHTTIWYDGLHFIFQGILPDWCGSTLMLLAEDRI